MSLDHLSRWKLSFEPWSTTVKQTETHLSIQTNSKLRFNLNVNTARAKGSNVLYVSVFHPHIPSPAPHDVIKRFRDSGDISVCERHGRTSVFGCLQSSHTASITTARLQSRTEKIGQRRTVEQLESVITQERGSIPLPKVQQLVLSVPDVYRLLKEEGMPHSGKQWESYWDQGSCYRFCQLCSSHILRY